MQNCEAASLAVSSFGALYLSLEDSMTHWFVPPIVVRLLHP
jgi:hypothetical protein